MRIKTIILIGLVFILALSCKSRLQPRLYQVGESISFLLKEVESFYRPGYILTDEPQTSYIRPGDGAILIAKRIGPSAGELQTLGKVFTVEEKIAYQILVELPASIRKDSLDLHDHSLCRLEGRFDVDERLRIYHCMKGFMVIDTVWTSSFRARLSGIYVNPENDTLIFEGDLKARRRN